MLPAAAGSADCISQPSLPPPTKPDPGAAIVGSMPGARPSSVEFPADDPERARRFWGGLLGAELEPRRDGEGEGWQTRSEAGLAVGVHERGRGPGDSFSLPYFEVAEMTAALERVEALGGGVVHPGERWSICRDSEGSPFGLALSGRPEAARG